MAIKILKKVDVEAIFPDGRVLRGFAYGYPESTKQSIFQIWDYNENDTWLVNLHLAESVKLILTFEDR